MRLNCRGTITVIEPAWKSSAPSGSASTLSTTRQSLSLQHVCGYHEWAYADVGPATTLANTSPAQATATGNARFGFAMLYLAVRFLFGVSGLVRLSKPDPRAYSYCGT